MSATVSELRAQLEESKLEKATLKSDLKAVRKESSRVKTYEETTLLKLEQCTLEMNEANKRLLASEYVLICLFKLTF